MITKKLLIVAAAAGAILSSSADAGHKAPTVSQSHNKYFVKGYVGADFYSKMKQSTFKMKSSDHLAAGVAAGYAVTDKLSASVDFSFRNATYKGNVGTPSISFKQKVKNKVVFLNGAYDIATYGAFTPYVTAGIGYSQLKPSAISGTLSGVTTSTAVYKKHNNIAYNAGLGSRFKLASNIDADLSYKFLMLGKLKSQTAGVKNHKLNAQEIAAGLVYKF